MIFKYAYIISWLGNEELAEPRRKALHNVVNWCKEKNLQPCVIASEWKDEWYSEFEGTDFIKVPYKVPPGHARNMGLNHFYSTKDDYCILLDDDTWIEKGSDVIDWLQSASEDDCKDLWLLIPSEVPEQGYIPAKDKHIFRQTHKFWAGAFIVKNIVKYTTMKELFFNPAYSYDDHGLMHGEDTNFGMRAYSLGLQPWQINTALVCKERSRDVLESTWLKSSMEDMADTRGLILSRELAKQEFTTNQGGVVMTPLGPVMLSICKKTEIQKERLCYGNHKS